MITVSHRMAELFTIADRLTVLKDGEVMATRERAETDHDDIVHLMIGRELSDLFPQRPTQHHPRRGPRIDPVGAGDHRDKDRCTERGGDPV